MASLLLVHKDKHMQNPIWISAACGPLTSNQALWTYSPAQEPLTWPLWKGACCFEASTGHQYIRWKKWVSHKLLPTAISSIGVSIRRKVHQTIIFGCYGGGVADVITVRSANPLSIHKSGIERSEDQELVHGIPLSYTLVRTCTKQKPVALVHLILQTLRWESVRIKLVRVCEWLQQRRKHKGALWHSVCISEWKVVSR